MLLSVLYTVRIAHTLLVSLLHGSNTESTLNYSHHSLLPTESGNDFTEPAWRYHVNPLQHSSLGMEDRVPHQQGHIADRPGAAQYESYAAAQGRQALQTTDTDLGWVGPYKDAHAEDQCARDAVSAQLINPAGASDFALGTHSVPSICRLPLAEAVCTYRCFTSIQDVACKAGYGVHAFVPVPICGNIAFRACAVEGILLALSATINRYGLLYLMMSSTI